MIGANMSIQQPASASCRRPDPERAVKVKASYLPSTAGWWLQVRRGCPRWLRSLPVARVVHAQAHLWVCKVRCTRAARSRQHEYHVGGVSQNAHSFGAVQQFLMIGCCIASFGFYGVVRLFWRFWSENWLSSLVANKTSCGIWDLRNWNQLHTTHSPYLGSTKPVNDISNHVTYLGCKT